MAFRLSLRRSIVVVVLLLVALESWIQWEFTVERNERLTKSQFHQLNQYYVAQIDKRVQALAAEYEQLMSLAQKRFQVLPEGSNWQYNAELYLRDIVASFPQLNGAFVGTSENALFGYVRISPTTFDYMAVDANDPAATIRFIPVDGNWQFGATRLSAEGFNVGARSWFVAGTDSVKPAWSAPFKYFAFDVTAIPLNVRIPHPNPEVTAVLSFNLYDSQLQSELARLQQGFPGHLAILDEQNRLLATSSPAVNRYCDAEPNCLLATATEFNLAGKTYFVDREIVAFGEATTWQMVGLIDLNELYQSRSALLTTSLYITLATALLVMLIFIVFARLVLKPLTEISRLMNNAWRDRSGFPLPDVTEMKGINTREVAAIHQAYRGFTQRINDYVAERRELTQKLDNQTQQLRHLALIPQSIDMAFVLTDRSGNIEWVNQAFERWFSQSATAVKGQNISDVLKLTKPIKKALQEAYINALLGKRRSIEIALGRGKRWIELSIEPIVETQTDKTVELLHVIRDISDNKAHERELGLWKEMFDHAQWGLIISTGDEPIIQRLNPYICELLGYSAKELINFPVRDLMDESTRVKIKAVLERIRQGLTSTYDARLFHKDGHLIDVRVSVNGVFDEHGDVIYRVAHIQALQQPDAAEK